MQKILPPDFYDRTTVDVARELLGKTLVRRVGDEQIVVAITETEAYQSDDPACHAFNGKTKRNAILFGPVGHTYVYFTYGMHFCVNIVSRDSSRCPAGGVLIRAVMPLTGHELIERNRSLKGSSFITGPGNVAKSLAIDLRHGGIDVTHSSSEIVLYDAMDVHPHEIQCTPRIGISQAQEKLWRFLWVPSR
jgi:DNA-3-methyladenine glycosylase